MSLYEWSVDRDATKLVALARLAGLRRVEHGVEPPCPPFAIGSKAEYHRGHEGHMSKEIREAPIVRVPLAGLRTIQRSVNPERVRQYIEDPDMRAAHRRGERGAHGGLVDYPIVVRQQGTRWIHDGHHRCTAAALAGDESIEARLVDLDAGKSRGDK